MPHLRTILSVTTATLGTLALVGCQRYTRVPRGGLNDVPLDVDQAMEIRDWEPMSARYTNPRFIAGPPGFWFIPAYGNPEPIYAFQETPMFVLQSLALPLTMWFPLPWTPVRYAGESVEPSWHAMPPLPPGGEGPPAPPDVIERGTDEPMPPPAPAPDAAGRAPYDDPAPGRTVIPGTQPTRGLEGDRLPATQRLDSDRPAPPRDVPATTPPPRGTTTAPAPRAATPAPAPAPSARVSTPAPGPAPARAATRPAVTNTPSAVTPARATPATRPTTAPARAPVNK